jgi:hypothetical protein
MEFLARQAKELPDAIEQVLQNAANELTDAKRTGRKLERPSRLMNDRQCVGPVA